MKKNYVKEIYGLKDGTFQIEVVRDGNSEFHNYATEEEAFDAYVEFCGEFYA